MGLWYLSTLLFVIFSGLYFAYDKDRLTPAEDYKTEIAGLFDACRQATILQAVQTPALGAAVPANLNCDTASLPVAADRNLNVPGIKSIIQPRSIRDPGQVGRMAVTYIPYGQAIMGVPFQDAGRQVRAVFGASITVGIVTGSAGDPVLNTNSNNAQVRVPIPNPPLYSIASVTLLD